MKRSLPVLVLVLLVISTIDASGQRWKLRRYEADIYVGSVAFHGDIGRASQPLANMVNGMRPSIGVTPRFKVGEQLAVSLDLGYLQFAGVDKEGESHNRLLSFSGHAFQHFARMEYLLVGGTRARSLGIYNRRGMVNNYNIVQIYLLGGFGGILSKSIVEDTENGNQEPIERPGYDPSLHYGVGFPVGGGLRFSLDPRWSLAAELTYTFTLSDYLDAYSSSFSDYKDTYYLLNIRSVWKIRNDRNGRPLFNKYYR